MSEEKRFCLIGRGIQGSLSPELMKAAYGGRYSYNLVDEDTFEAAWARAMDYDGFNVTAPYKFEAYGASFGHDRNSMGAEAANLVMPMSFNSEPNLRKSFNTDVDGITGALLERGVPKSTDYPRSAMIVGTGGAAAAAQVALTRDLNCFSIIAGRDVEKARRMCFPDTRRSFLEPILGRDYTGLNPIVLDNHGDIHIIVYTLPGSAPVPEGLPLENAVVLEAEYKNPRLANLPCRKYISGKLWLLHQAIAGYRIMTGEEPDIDRMRKVLCL